MIWDPDTNPQVGSFMPALVHAVTITSGPILELGTGVFSTPYLAALIPPRLVCSYEYDPIWAAEARRRFPLLPVFESFESLPERRWAVVLVDCEGWMRQKFFDALKADIFVVHDTQDGWVSEVSLNRFEYRVDYGENPVTTMVSDVLGFDGFTPPI